MLITDSGRKCLEELVKIENENKTPNVIVILDSHLKDISLAELAKQIRDRKQQNDRIIIIITSTLPLDSINSMDMNLNSNVKILLKPFKLSKLLPSIGNMGLNEKPIQDNP